MPITRVSLQSVLCFAVTSALVAVATGAGQSNEAPGIKLGEKAPSFNLPDPSGKEHSLKDMLNKGHKIALVFYRSADW